MHQVERLVHNTCFQLIISVGFMLFSVVFSQIPLGSKLTIVENNHWVSSDGNFAIGFFNHSDQHSVGIRFNSNSIPISEQTVIWVVGAQITVGNESYFELTRNGELVLFDSTRGVIVWTSNTSNLSVSSAILFDNGNLVLSNKKRGIVWQTFDTPTDTLVPGQSLSGIQYLRASTRTSLSSYYTLRVLGYLELRWETSVVYWTSGSPSRSLLQTILKSDGTIELLDEKLEVIWTVFGEDHNDSDVKFRFLRIDIDGNLRLYSWVEILKSWKPVWQALENQCDVFATCGSQGICVYNSSGNPVCKCPFLPSPESNLKCLAPYREECKSRSFMTRYDNTFLYEIYSPNETITQGNLQQCRSLCEDDPLCYGVTFTNDRIVQCRFMKSQYITGHTGPSISSISFVKRCNDPIAVLPLNPSSSTSSPSKSSLTRSNEIPIFCLIGVALGALVVFFLVQFGVGVWFFYKRRNYNMRKKFALDKTSLHSNGLISLSFSEIKDLTENFKHEIGPNMFKGMLPNNKPIAVKELKVATEGRKFRSTVLIIGSIFHRNLLQLVGYCCESDHRILVYEFPKNGSLKRCLEDSKLCKRLTWGRRMKICLNVAKGISYLHTECREFISHGNLKCENVFLDENLEVKESEFGLGRIQGERSTLGGGEAEGDVKDFGKMVLELVSGRGEADDSFFKSVFENWKTGRGENVVDGRIEDGIKSEELERLLRIAFWCLQFDERMRPSMGEVVKVLEGTLSVDPPPFPFSFGRRQEEMDISESD